METLLASSTCTHPFVVAPGKTNTETHSPACALDLGRTRLTMLPWREPDREPALSALRWAALVTGATGLRSGRTVRCEVASASGEACAEAAESSEAWARSPPEPPAFGAGAAPALAGCWAEPSCEVERESDPASGACGAEESAWLPAPVSAPAPEPAPEPEPVPPGLPPGWLPAALSVPGRPLSSGFGFGAFWSGSVV